MAQAMKLVVDRKTVQRLERDAPGSADREIGRIAFATEGRIKDSFSSQSPSAPGEPPGIDTGMLKNSVHVTKIKPGVYQIGDGTEYGAAQEFGAILANGARLPARPWLRPGLRWARGQLERVLGAVVKVR